MHTSSQDNGRAAWDEWRRGRDQFFKHHYASPLPDEVMAGFETMDCYDFDPGMVFEAKLQPDGDEEVEIVASTGSRSAYRVAGTVAIPFPDEPRALIVLRGEEDDMFIPFSDETCGIGSYGGGRYVSPTRGPEGTMIVDFNRSINPYCAYDPEFSCPLPPAENRLSLKIEAGEKDFAAAG